MNKTNKFDNVIFNFLKKYYLEILFAIVTMCSLIMRIDFIKFKSDDYTDFLINWFNMIKENGGLLALNQEIGDYNIPYLVIMAILTYIPLDSLISIKIVSIVFDYTMAIVSMFIIYELFKENKHKHLYALIAYSIISILPTVVLNSSAWAQCDSIYTTFILLTILFAIKEKYLPVFIFFGIAFSFKLQAIFILPVLIILYVANKKFPIYYFLIIPVVNFIMSLPAIIMGRSINSCLSIYLSQTGNYSGYISMNFPNVYTLFIENIEGSNLFKNIDNGLATYGILITLLIFTILAIIIIYKKLRIDTKMIITLSLWSVVICTFFLPHMHDRYMYMADVISILWFIVHKRKIYIPIIINFASLYTYFRYLYFSYSLEFQYVTILNFIALFVLTKELILELKNNADIETIKEKETKWIN